MAALHTALSTLGPAEYSSVPQDSEELTEYLRSAFQAAQTIIDSVPAPPPSDLALENTTTHSQSLEAKDISDISVSSARSDLLDPENASLQKEWGKPLKMSVKDNPLSISTYKLGGKDGKGAWFARRSVHSGMSFKRWKLSLEREFPETLETQGGPGVGNIRGIGGEKKVESKHVPGIGTQEVYYLTAQFPGPSAPRDFVTLLLVSSNALYKQDDQSSHHIPRHYMVISKPCVHPETPARNGFVRGQYESVEFIREIPRKPKRAASALDLTMAKKDSGPSDKAAQDEGATESQSKNSEAANGSVARDASRRRSKTVSLAKPSPGNNEEEKGDESNPVEWIMITRSDPGGSVPRFMVERGTPGSIVADASKFLAWATKKDHSAVANNGVDEPTKDQEKSSSGPKVSTQANKPDSDRSTEEKIVATETQPGPEPSSTQSPQSSGILTNLTNAAKAGIGAYAPKAISDQLPGHSDSVGASKSIRDGEANEDDDISLTRSSSPTASFVSFSSSDDNADDSLSTQSPSSHRKSDNQERKTLEARELERHNERKRALDEKLAKTKEKETKDREQLGAREEQRIRKAEEKHGREVAKQEERYTKQMAKLEAKKRKTEEKDDKVRFAREKEELKQQLEGVKSERDLLLEQVRALQKENTGLVLRLGKMEDGKKVLQEVKAEVISDTRSRSSTLKKIRPATPDTVNGATVLGKSSTLKENGKP